MQMGDDFGRTLPDGGYLHGQMKLQVHDGSVGRVVAQAIVENPERGISIPLSCSVCPPQPVNLYLLTSPNGLRGSKKTRRRTPSPSPLGYYDPSYGVTYAGARDFENKAVAGYSGLIALPVTPPRIGRVIRKSTGLDNIRFTNF